MSLEKKAAGVTWKSVLKAAQGGGEEASLPLREGLEDTLSPEELEKARKLLTELQDKGELVCLFINDSCHVMCLSLSPGS